MSNDSRTDLIEQLRRWIDEGNKLVAPYQRALVAALQNAEGAPYSVRFANLKIIEAVLKYLNEEAIEGATFDEMRDALMAGGAAYNMPNFERDLKNSLIRAVKFSVLIRHGERYLPGKKPPSYQMNRHKK